MKILLNLICFYLIAFQAPAQNDVKPTDASLHLQIPLINRIDYGFKNPVVRAEQVQYYADDTIQEPKEIKVCIFSDFGFITMDYTQYLGLENSEIAKEYFYEDGTIDSLAVTNTDITKDTFHKFKTNSRGHVLKEIVTGANKNYTVDYTYDQADNITTIIMKSTSGDTTMATYFYENYNLDYVIEEQKNKKGKTIRKVIYYDNKEPFMSATLGYDDAVFYHSQFGSCHFRLPSKSTMKELVSLKKLKQENPWDFDKKMLELYDANSIVEQHMDARGEPGDWIKRYAVTSNETPADTTSKKRYIFRKVYYKDTTTSGSTDFDALFQMRVPRKN